MNKFFKLIIVMVLFAQGGCTTYGKIIGVPSEGQKFVNKTGLRTLISTKTNIVAIGLHTETIKSGQIGHFAVVAKNRTKDDILFSTSDVSASTNVENSSQTAMLKVISNEEIERREKQIQGVRSLGKGFQAASNALDPANADYSNMKQADASQRSDICSNYGYGYDFSVQVVTLNAAQANSETNTPRLKAKECSSSNYLESTALLKKEKISPGEWYGGIVKVKLPQLEERTQEIIIVVNLDEEKHTFTYTQEKIEGE